MIGFVKQPSGPVKHPHAPFHPETLTELREIDLGELPKSYNSDKVPGYVRQTGVLAGRPEDVLEKMEAAFLHWPDVSFARREDGAIVLYNFGEVE